MDIITAYNRFLQMVNGNQTSNRVSVDKPRFVLLFNSAQIRYVENVLNKRNEDEVRYISKLLVSNKELGKVGDQSSYSSFLLPDNYLNLASASAIASKDKCIDRLDLYEVKPENLEEVLKDWSHKPSFKWRSAPYHTSDGHLLIYTEDFKVEKAFLNYYRDPIKVDIQGYKKTDKTPSSSIDPELPDVAVEKILRIMAKEVAANTGDGGQYQLERDRLNSPV